MQDYNKQHVIPECFNRESIFIFQGVFDQKSMKGLKLTKDSRVFICEGRPSLDAGQKNSSVFLQEGITPTLISDNMAGFLFFKDLVKEVYIACQYADNKGALCDMGALILAVLAQKHKVPVKLLAAEHRKRFLGDPQDILSFQGQRIAPKGAQGYVPLVEWVPAEYLRN